MYSVSNLMKMHYRDISCLARKLGLPGNLKKSILVSAIALYNSGKRNEADKIILDAKVMRYKKCRSSIGKNSKTIRMNRSMISSGKNHRSPQFCINEPRYTMPPPFIPIGLFDDSDSSNLHVRTFYSSTPTLDSSESNDNDIFDLSNSPHPLTPIPSTSPIINRRNWYPPTTRQQIYMQPFSSYSNAGIYTDPQFMYPYTQRTTTMGNYNEHRLSQSNMHSFEFYATDLMVGQNTSSTDGTCTASFVTNSQFYYGRHLSVMQNCPANLLPAVPQLTADNVPSQILSNVESANISSLSENQSNEGRLSEIRLLSDKIIYSDLF